MSERFKERAESGDLMSDSLEMIIRIMVIVPQFYVYDL